METGKTFSLIVRNVHLLGSRIDLTPHLPSGGPFQLLFEAENGSPLPVLILDRMDLRIFEGHPIPPPSPIGMTLAFFAFGLAIVLSILLALRYGWRLRRDRIQAWRRIATDDVRDLWQDLLRSN